MASAYSLRRDYGAPVQIYDFNLIGQALQYKQARYDANAASIQNQIDQIANLQLAKGVDRDYLNDRLSGLMNEVNSFGSADLSQNSISSAIQNHVKQAVDDKVIKAYKSTQQLQRTYNSISKIREEHPDQWSPQNEYDALRGVDEYLNNTAVGAEYTGKEMTPYQDVNAAIDERVKNADKYLRNVTKMTRAEGDYFVDEKNEIVSPQRLRALIESTLTPQLQNQMRIDANYGMMNANRLDLEDQMGGYFDAQLEDIDKNLEYAQKEVKTINKNSKKYREYNKTIQELQDRRISVIRSKNSLPEVGDEQLRTFIYKNDLMDNYERMYGGILSQEVTYRVNSAPLNREKFNWQKEKDMFDMAYKKAELGLKGLKTKMSIQEKMKLGLPVFQGVPHRIQEGVGEISYVDMTAEQIEESGLTAGQRIEQLKNKSNSNLLTQFLSNMKEDKAKIKNDEDLEKFKTKYNVDPNKSEFTDEDAQAALSTMKSRMEGDVDLKVAGYTPSEISMFKDLEYWEQADATRVKKHNEFTDNAINTLINGTLTGYNEGKGKIKVKDFVVDKNGNTNFGDSTKETSIMQFMQNHLKAGRETVENPTLDDITEDAAKALKIQVASYAAGKALEEGDKDLYNRYFNYRNGLINTSASERKVDEGAMSTVSKGWDKITNKIGEQFYGILWNSGAGGEEGEVYYNKYLEYKAKSDAASANYNESEYFNQLYNQDTSGLLRQLDEDYNIKKDKSLSRDVKSAIIGAASSTIPGFGGLIGAARMAGTISDSELIGEDSEWGDMDDEEVAGTPMGYDGIIKSGFNQQAVDEELTKLIGKGSTAKNIKFDSETAGGDVMVKGLAKVLESKIGDDMAFVGDETTMSITYQNIAGVEKFRVNGYERGTQMKKGGEPTVFLPSPTGKDTRPIYADFTKEEFESMMPSESLQLFNENFDRTSVNPARMPDSNPDPNISQVIPGFNDLTDENNFMIENRYPKEHSPSTITNELMKYYAMIDDKDMPKEEKAGRKQAIKYLMNFGGFEAKPIGSGDEYKTVVGVRDSKTNKFTPVYTLGKGGSPDLNEKYIDDLVNKSYYIKTAMLEELVYDDASTRMSGYGVEDSSLIQIIEILNKLNQQ